MSNYSLFKILSVFSLTLFLLSVSGIAEARGFGGGGFSRGGGGGFSRGGGDFSRGGGGFSRGGAASAGSFSRGGEGAQRSGQFQAGQGGASERQGQRQSSASQLEGQRQQALGGSESSMADRQTQRQQSAGDMQQSNQNYRTQNREDWQDYGEDQRWDNHWHGYGNTGAAFVAGATVGAAATVVARPATTTYITRLPCSYTTAFINGSTFYRCGSTWYSRGYVNGNVNYVVVAPPPGF